MEGQLAASTEVREFSGTPALRLRDFHVQMPGEEVEGVDLSIYEGEIFGIGGLAGQGKLGIPNGIMGLYDTSGTVEVFGEALKLDKLGDALQKGVSFVSEDRRGVGLLLADSIRDNIIFTAMQIKKEFLSAGLLNARQANSHAQTMVKQLDIRCTGIGQAVGSLSGGNQQKVCLARALTTNPRILIVSEPTRGIDIGAKKLVIDLLRSLNRDTGTTIVMVSSELVELRSICDRIAVVSDGRVSAILRPGDTDASFGLAMSGLLQREEDDR